MERHEHPFSPALDRDMKVLVEMPDKRLRWRKPRWRLGGWYVRDGYGWRELISKTPGAYEAGTF